MHDAVAAAVRRARAAGGVYGDVEATGVLEERSERRVEELNERDELRVTLLLTYLHAMIFLHAKRTRSTSP